MDRTGGHRGADATKPQAETGITGTRPAGSTASFSWRTLRPPRGTPRARGRGRSAPPRPTIPKAKPRPPQIETCAEEDDEEVEVEESGELEEEEGGAGPQTAPPEALPDDEEIERREEHYQRLRRTIGVGKMMRVRMRHSVSILPPWMK